jgi:hypothetical protein
MIAFVFAAGQTCGTGWAAIHTRGEDRIVKRAVRGVIPADNGVPALLIAGISG